MVQTVIGIIGENGGGKDTAEKMLLKMLDERGIAANRCSSGGVLVDGLDVFNIPRTRENLQKLAIVMDQAYGKGTLSRAVAKRFERRHARIIIFNGVRWWTDEAITDVLIYVTASKETRFNRMKERGEKKGEDTMTFEQFLKEDGAETEALIPEIGITANFKIVNEGTVEDMEVALKEFCDKVLPQFL